MIRRIFSIALISFFSVSCEEEIGIKEFPVIITLTPKNVDETGATFTAEVVLEGDNETTSYGFTWSVQDPDITTSEKIVVGDRLSKGVFEARIDYTLARGFEYKIRAFATYGNKTTYGNTVVFESKGSEKSIWSKELSKVTLEGLGTPYGWSDGEYAYVVFQDGKVHRFDPDEKMFSSITDFPESGNSGTKYTSVGINNVQYVFSDIDKNLYELKEGAWSIKSNTPFYYGSFGRYYHGYSTLSQVFLLSSSQSFSYDLETNSWQSKSVMPAANFSIGGTDLNSVAYVMDTRKNVQKYNPQENSWEFVSIFPGNFPEGSVQFNRFYGQIIGFSYENSIYFGFSSDDNATDIEENIWGFNLTTNSWEEIEAFPEDLSSSEVFHFSLKGKLYIARGDLGNYTIYSLNTLRL